MSGSGTFDTITEMNYLFAPERYETSQFVLRGYQPGDGPLLNEAVNASYDHLKTFMPWAKPDVPREESEKLAREFRGKYLLAQDFVIGIFSPAGDKLLGGTGFHPRNNQLSARIAEIGMWIRADRAGQGLGTAALSAMLTWGFTAWPWRRLFWRCDTRNTASARTAEKAGLRLEGTFQGDMSDVGGVTRDTHFYAMLRHEWQTKHNNNP